MCLRERFNISATGNGKKKITLSQLRLKTQFFELSYSATSIEHKEFFLELKSHLVACEKGEKTHQVTDDLGNMST